METKIAFIERPGGPIRVEARPLPELEVGSVLLRTRYSEVCGTDCHLFHGKLVHINKRNHDGAEYSHQPCALGIVTITNEVGDGELAKFA